MVVPGPTGRAQSNRPLLFFVQARNSIAPTTKNFPYVVLRSDNWNDYGYQTSFTAHLKRGVDDELELGAVKILDENDDPVTKPPEKFEQLPENFCSLGTSLDYYEALADMPRAFRENYVAAMRDVAVNSTLLRKFRELQGFRVSLLRDPSAEEALEAASSILFDEDYSQEFKFEFVDKNETSLLLDFSSSTELPGRLNAIIGYNGSGKTRTLSELAQVASMGSRVRDQDNFLRTFGRISENARFSSVVAVSFSPFDTFEVPDTQQSRTDQDEQYGYVYCGLRSFKNDFETSSQSDMNIALKGVAARRDELVESLNLIKSNKRRDVLRGGMRELLREPSFESLVGRDGQAAVESIIRDPYRFRELSSGHQIALSIIVLLTCHVRSGSLVLIDEPESHLHPPLLAALIKSILVLLQENKAFAVVATHSPIVLQEIPAKCVSILRRMGNESEFHRPRFETYGENLDILTAEAFHRDNSISTYEGNLRSLAKRLTPEQLLRIFPQGPSSQAVSILMQAGFRFPERYGS